MVDDFCGRSALVILEVRLLMARKRIRTQCGSVVSRGKKGFTLIELMLVVIIIGIIAAIAVPRLAGRTEKARIAAASQTIASLSAALDAFELAVGRFPTTEEGLESLVIKPPALAAEDQWDGPARTGRG